MSTRIRFPIAVAGMCLICTTACADEKRSESSSQPLGEAASKPMPESATTVDVKQLPAPVQATIARHAEHVGTVQRQRMASGATVYHATVSKGGKNYQLDIADDGMLLDRRPVADPH